MCIDGPRWRQYKTCWLLSYKWGNCLKQNRNICIECPESRDTNDSVQGDYLSMPKLSKIVLLKEAPGVGKKYRQSGRNLS